MKNYILLVASIILFNNTANAVIMAPWTRSIIPFEQVLQYLNDNSLIVTSMACSKESGSIINASVLCPNRKSTILFFDENNLVHETEISLNKPPLKGTLY